VNAAVNRVVVIGTGIVGLNVGLRLLREGMRVEFIDPRPPGSGASYGNAGVIAVEAAVPTGMPSMLSGAPGFLLRQQGPIVVKPAYFLQALPWLVRFLSACRPQRVEQISTALHSMTRFALEEYERLFADLGLDDDIRRTGALMLYHTPASFQGAQAAIQLRRRRGANIEILGEKEVRDMEPASGPVHRGIYFPDYASLDSPQLLCQRLADRASTLGAVFHEAEARSIGVAGGRPASIHFSDGRDLQLNGAAVIIAAGAHSRGLAADVGCDVPLDTERGYHVEIENPNITLGRPVLVSDGAFFASTMQGRLRLAGTVEIAGLSQRAGLASCRRHGGKGEKRLPRLAGDRMDPMDGVSPVGAAFTAGDWRLPARLQCLCRLWTWASWHDLGCGHRDADRRRDPGSRSESRSKPLRALQAALFRSALNYFPIASRNWYQPATMRIAGARNG
jgi:glycine/D-amino acid oxidase-like deaminating enzyme